MMLSKTYLTSLTLLSTFITLPTLLYAQCTNSTAPSPSGRYYYNLASANNNKLYMFGGSLATASFDVWSLDLTQPINTGCPPWERALSSNITDSMGPYIFGIAFNPNNQKYIFVQGGDAINTKIQQNIMGYDTTQNSFTLPTAPVGPSSMPPRSRMTATVDSLNNKVWVVGGRNTFAFNQQGTLTEAYSDIYSYQFGDNPGSMKVEKAAITSHYGNPISRFGHATVLVDNKLFMLGGYTGSQNPDMVIEFASVSVYDIHSSTMVSMDTTGDIPAARIEFSAVTAPDSRSIILFGGITMDSLKTVTNDVYVLDTCTLTWRKQFINGHSQGRATHQAYMYGKYMITMMGISGHNGNAPIPNDSIGILDTDSWTWVTTTDSGYSAGAATSSPSCSYAFPAAPTEDRVIGTSPKNYDNTVISNPWASSDTLTAPEKGGIGVAVPLFVIACLVAAFFFYRRRQRNKSRQLNPRWMPGALSSANANSMSRSTDATEGHTQQQRNNYPLFTYNNNNDSTNTDGNTVANPQGGLRTYTATDHDQWERQLIQDSERPQPNDDKAMTRHEDIWSRMRGLHAPGDEERR